MRRRSKKSCLSGSVYRMKREPRIAAVRTLALTCATRPYQFFRQSASIWINSRTAAILAACSPRSAGPFVTLIAVAAADCPFRLSRLIGFLRAADIVHFLEASSCGALGVRAGFRTAYEIPFGRRSGTFCAGAFRSLFRHIFSSGSSVLLRFARFADSTAAVPPLRQQDRAGNRRAQSAPRR